MAREFEVGSGTQWTPRSARRRTVFTIHLTIVVVVRDTPLHTIDPSGPQRSYDQNR